MSDRPPYEDVIEEVAQTVGFDLYADRVRLRLDRPEKIH